MIASAINLILIVKESIFDEQSVTHELTRGELEMKLEDYSDTVILERY